MGNKHINIKAILFCKWKATLVFVSLIFHQFAKDRLVSSSWTSDYEFCETRWFEFLSDKNKWNRTCGNETMNMSWCCIAEKDYLLERFKRFSHACPLEGKCGCSKVEVNSTVRYRSEVSNISWVEPANFTCPHKYILENVKKPNKTSPHDFLGGKYKIPYIYKLYGGKKVTCNVDVNVKYIPPSSEMEGQCNCTEVERNASVSQLIPWTEPNMTCPYRFVLENITKPEQTSPHWFSFGKHVLPYTFNLYGGHQVTCNVLITANTYGKCSCTEVRKTDFEHELIHWTEPKMTCPFDYKLKNITKPWQTSPRSFPVGDHVLRYTYNLYGGQRVTCKVIITSRPRSGGCDTCLSGTCYGGICYG